MRSNHQFYVSTVLGGGLMGMFLIYPWGALIGVVIAGILCYGHARVTHRQPIPNIPLDAEEEEINRQILASLTPEQIEHLKRLNRGEVTNGIPLDLDAEEAASDIEGKRESKTIEEKK